MQGTILANQSSKKRRALDFYPTPPDVTHALMDFLHLHWSTLVWEPACGDGAMAEVFKKRGYKVMASDLRETGYGQGGVDFLETRRDCDAIITNPPFSLSEQFIRHGISQAPVVAMLLKSQYWHAAKRMDLFTDFPPAYVLPLTWRPDFMGGERGGAPTMEVLWTVWIKGESDTRYRLLGRPRVAGIGPPRCSC
jgi:hypothetical protein